MDYYELLKNLSESKIDLVVTDPPYNKKKDFSNDNLPTDKFVEFTDKWISAVSEKLKPTGSLYCFVNLECLWMFKSILDRYLVFQNLLVWHFDSMLRKNATNYENRCEFVFFYTKSDEFTWNHQREPPSDMTLRSWLNRADKDGYIMYDDLCESDKARFKRENYDKSPRNVLRGPPVGNVLRFARVSSRSKERMGHPTQKPESIVEIFVKASSNEGDLVLDPFVGSGTTMIVAKRFRRRFVGSEIDGSFYEMARYRLDEEVVSVRMDEFFTTIDKFASDD